VTQTLAGEVARAFGISSTPAPLGVGNFAFVPGRFCLSIDCAAQATKAFRASSAYTQTANESELKYFLTVIHITLQQLGFSLYTFDHL
jgi:hypothetical protein